MRSGRLHSLTFTAIHGKVKGYKDFLSAQEGALPTSLCGHSFRGLFMSAGAGRGIAVKDSGGEAL